MFLSLWALLYIILLLQGAACIIPHFPHQRVRQIVMKFFTKISHIKFIKYATIPFPFALTFPSLESFSLFCCRPTLIVYAIVVSVLLYQSISSERFNRKMKNQETAPIAKMNYLIGYLALKLFNAWFHFILIYIYKHTYAHMI